MMQTALEEAVADGDAAKGLLQAERESTALLSKARAAAVEVSHIPQSHFMLLPLVGFICVFDSKVCMLYARA